MTIEEPTPHLRWLRWISASRGPFKLQQCWAIIEYDENHIGKVIREEWRDVPWVEEPAPIYTGE